MSIDTTRTLKHKYTLRERIPLPDYTIGEEVINTFSHSLGAVLGIVTMVLCIIKSAFHHSTTGVVSSVIFGVCLILLYSISSIYHGLKKNQAKRIFRILDHCSIFLLIAGTYTPFTLVTLPPKVGFTIFGIIWACAILGIVLNAIDLQRFSTFSMICYLVMGWMIILAFPVLRLNLHPNGIVLLVAGGIAYTAGTITFGLGSRIRYMHSIWHFFVLAGSILHSLAILLYAL